MQSDEVWLHASTWLTVKEHVAARAVSRYFQRVLQGWWQGPKRRLVVRDHESEEDVEIRVRKAPWSHLCHEVSSVKRTNRPVDPLVRMLTKPQWLYKLEVHCLDEPQMLATLCPNLVSLAVTYMDLVDGHWLPPQLKELQIEYSCRAENLSALRSLRTLKLQYGSIREALPEQLVELSVGCLGPIAWHSLYRLSHLKTLALNAIFIEPTFQPSCLKGLRSLTVLGHVQHARFAADWVHAELQSLRICGTGFSNTEFSLQSLLTQFPSVTSLRLTGALRVDNAPAAKLKSLVVRCIQYDPDTEVRFSVQRLQVARSQDLEQLLGFLMNVPRIEHLVKPISWHRWTVNQQRAIAARHKIVED